MTAGCGGDGNDAAPETAPPPPAIAAPAAERLAAASDAVADALEAGDVCGAAGLADDLKDAAIAAINDGQVPRRFQEELLGRAQELVNAVNCPPPPAEESDDGDEEEEKKNDQAKKKKDKKQDGEGDGEIELPIPLPGGDG